MSETDNNYLAVTQDMAATTTVIFPNDNRVQEITTMILRNKAQIACSFIQIGKLLDEARGHLKKDGLWLLWLESSVDISVRMAQRYIQLARAFPDATSISHLGMTKALALLDQPESQREAFITEPHEVNVTLKRVDELSVRDIKRIIRETTEEEERLILHAMHKGDYIKRKKQDMVKFLENRPDGFETA